MEIAELDRRLLELTASEISYRDGAHYDWEVLGSRVEVDGRSVLEMGRAVVDRDQDGMPEGFAIVRNSRFNQVPEHVHDYVEISYVYHGRCPQVVNGEALELAENEVLLLDASCPHAVASLDEGDVMLSVIVSREFLQASMVSSLPGEGAVSRFLLNVLNAETDHRGHVHFHCGQSRRVRRCFQEMLCERLEPTAVSPRIVQHLFLLLLIELMDCYERELTQTGGLHGGTEALVAGMLGFIERRQGACTLGEVAQHFCVSPNYASALLKRRCGKTFMQLAQDARLTRAATLLRRGATVDEAAHAAGYENLTFFYRKFRARYDCTPAAYRRAR